MQTSARGNTFGLLSTIGYSGYMFKYWYYYIPLLMEKLVFLYRSYVSQFHDGWTVVD